MRNQIKTIIITIFLSTSTIGCLQPFESSTGRSISSVELGSELVEEVNPVNGVRPTPIELVPPVNEVTPPVAEVQPPVVEVIPPVVEVKPPVAEVQPPVVEVKPPVDEELPLFEFFGERVKINVYVPGFSALEPYKVVGSDEQTIITYGYIKNDEGFAHFPDQPSLVGDVKIPVFMVDWSDFNPKTDLSNKNNPNSIALDYKRSTPQELQKYLNGPNGPADYFSQISGGKLKVTFEVFGWMISDEMTYLKDKEPNYYYYQDRTKSWYADKTKHAKDILRSAVVDLGVDFRKYDSDKNNILDGFVVVYEGGAGALAGTNMSWTETSSSHFNSISTLVDKEDVNYNKFKDQNILFKRYNNIPEKLYGNNSNFVSVTTWAHELGHLLLGFRDYYHTGADLGYYALSARSGGTYPLHPAALEKELFTGWIKSKAITSTGFYTLDSHHLDTSSSYEVGKNYLYKILINEDPNHYLTIENRKFYPQSDNKSVFNSYGNDLNLVYGSNIESGLVIFEVNRHTTETNQLQRLKPDGRKDAATFQRNDTLNFKGDNNFNIEIKNISSPGEAVNFEVILK